MWAATRCALAPTKPEEGQNKMNLPLITTALLLVTLTSPSVAEEKRIHAKVGSFWNYTVTDENQAD
jgi:hypothetical protein